MVLLVYKVKLFQLSTLIKMEFADYFTEYFSFLDQELPFNYNILVKLPFPENLMECLQVKLS